mmetsp:Transcript_23988/g.57914  ORF Transcript_23988/g.57914 Transcript_23988/m.57914 type:complete len:221 (-) Transcript_23988:688-1350(-)
MKSSLSALQPTDFSDPFDDNFPLESCGPLALLAPFAPACWSSPAPEVPVVDVDAADFLIMSKNPCFVLDFAPSLLSPLSPPLFALPSARPSSLILRFSSSLSVTSAATAARCFDMALNSATTPRVAMRRWVRSASISATTATASSFPEPPFSSSSHSLLPLFFSLPDDTFFFFFCFHNLSADISAVGANGNRIADRFSARRFCRLVRRARSSVRIFCCSL